MTTPQPQDAAPKPCPLCGAEMVHFIGIGGSMWNHPVGGCLLDRFEVIPFELAAWNRRAPSAPTPDTGAVVAAARAVIGARFSTYKARNGREVGIEDSSGEMCWIVPFDPMHELEAALGQSAPSASEAALREAIDYYLGYEDDAAVEGAPPADPAMTGEGCPECGSTFGEAGDEGSMAWAGEQAKVCPECGCEEIDHRGLLTCRCPAGLLTTAPGEAPGAGRWRKKPVVIDAFQLGAGDVVWFAPWFPAPPKEDITADGIVIHTLEGDHLARWGDWIIKGVKGEFYPCKPDIFAATYEPAPSAARPAAPITEAMVTAAQDAVLNHPGFYTDAHGNGVIDKDASLQDIVRSALLAARGPA